MNAPVHLVGSHRRHIGKSLRLGWDRWELAAEGWNQQWMGKRKRLGGRGGMGGGTGKGLGCAGRFIKLVSVEMGEVLKGCARDGRDVLCAQSSLYSGVCVSAQREHD